MTPPTAALASSRAQIGRELQEFLFEFMPSLLSDMESCIGTGFPSPVVASIVNYFAMIRSIAKIGLDGPGSDEQLNRIQAMGSYFERWSEVDRADSGGRRKRARQKRALNDLTHAVYSSYSFSNPPIDQNRIELIQRIREAMAPVFSDLARSDLTYLRQLCEGRLTPSMAYESTSRRSSEGVVASLVPPDASKADLHKAFEITCGLRTADLKKLTVLLGIPAHQRPNNSTAEADGIDIVIWAEMEGRIIDLLCELDMLINIR